MGESMRADRAHQTEADSVSVRYGMHAQFLAEPIG